MFGVGYSAVAVIFVTIGSESDISKDSMEERSSNLTLMTVIATSTNGRIPWFCLSYSRRFNLPRRIDLLSMYGCLPRRQDPDHSGAIQNGDVNNPIITIVIGRET